MYYWTDKEQHGISLLSCFWELIHNIIHSSKVSQSNTSEDDDFNRDPWIYMHQDFLKSKWYKYLVHKYIINTITSLELCVQSCVMSRSCLCKSAMDLHVLVVPSEVYCMMGAFIVKYNISKINLRFSLHTGVRTKRPIRPVLISVLCSMKWLGVFLSIHTSKSVCCWMEQCVDVMWLWQAMMWYDVIFIYPAVT